MLSVDSEDPRAEMYVHALAQLPDELTLVLSRRSTAREGLMRLVRAYGMADRVRVEDGGDSREGEPGVDAAATTMGELVERLTLDGDPPSSPRRDDAQLVGQRVAVITNVPAPYRVPLFNAMSSRLTEVGAQLRVLFQGSGSTARPWIGSGGEMEFDYETLKSVELPVGGRRPRMPMDLEAGLKRFSPTVVICGGYSPIVAPRAARTASRHGAAFGLWGGEVAWRPAASSRARRAVRAWLVRRADFGIAYGSDAADYLKGLGPGLPVVHGRNSSSAYATRRDRPPRPETVELLTVADMGVPGKCVDLLVDALRLVPALRCRLTVVGGGGKAQRAVVERADHDPRIRFLGAVPQARVRDCYAESDVYLFPSRIDVFGLALVEAMGSGLAPVTSTRPGAATDLAVHERNCLTVGPHEATAWAQAIERIVSDHDLRVGLGERARRTIAARWTIEHACEAMFAGIRLGLIARRVTR